MSIWFGILILLVLFSVIRSKKLRLIKYVVFVCAVALCLVALLCLDGRVEKIPWITSEPVPDFEVTTDATCLLSSGASIATNVDFIISSSQTVDDIAEYLEGTSKNVYFYLKDGSDYLYSKNLGMLDSSDASMIYDLYTSWKESGTLPSEATTYKFLIFTIKV